MIAQHLQGGILPGALGKVDQPHVIADHKSHQQGNHHKNHENHRDGVQENQGLLGLVFRGVDLVHLRAVLEDAQAGLGGIQQVQRCGGKGALAQAFPGAAFHI